MFKYKLRLDNRRNQKRKSGFPVTIWLTVNNNRKKVILGLCYEVSEWDFDKQEPVSDFRGKIVIKEKKLILEQIELEFLQGKYSSLSLIELRLKGSKGSSAGMEDFISFGRLLAKEKAQINKYKTASVYDNVLNQLIKYRSKVAFSDVDYGFLNGFKYYQLSAGNAKNTAHNYLRTLRAIYNEGVRRGLSEDQKPFKGVFSGITVKSNRTKKRNLSKESISKLESEAELPPGQQLAVDLFLLLFYFGGQDLKDLYYLENAKIANNRVFFTRGKLDEGGYEFDLQIFHKISTIIKKYSVKGKYLFPWRKDAKGYETFKRRFQYNLVKVQNKLGIEVLPLGGNVSIKVARHTFATIGKQLFIDPDLLRELMGHERDDVDTIYKDKYPQKVRDEAHWKIIG